MNEKAEPELRSKARDAVTSRRLPARAPDHLWGGPGCGAHCVICGNALEATQMVFDLEFAAPQAGQEPQSFQVHVSCFRAWEVERANLQQGRIESTVSRGEFDQAHCGT